MYRVIIADDHAVVCTGLKLILNQTIDLRLTEQARNGDELLEKLTASVYDLVILDISMTGKDALDTLKEIKSSYPSLPIVIFTMNPDESFAARMFTNGASAYVNKETQPEQIISIIRQVLRGGKYITPKQNALLENYTSHLNIFRHTAHNLLTDREYQVLHLLVQGIKKSDIASSLSVSKNTVSNHRNSIMKKLNIASNSELTRYAMQHGLIS